jgi:UDP-N-acetylglucosamine transferase subunit ALG13
MKKLKHSKYKNTGILFEMLVRKLTSETLSSNKTVTVDIIKKYFGKNTELSKELQLYNALLKEHFKSEAQGLDYIRTVKSTYDKLNQSVLKRQRYNLVKEISEKFVFSNMSKIHISNYKPLASIYMIFEYEETSNPKQLLECKNVIIQNGTITEKKQIEKDLVLESFESQPKDIRLLTYKLLVDKFNEKYSVLDESQKQLLNKYITNVNDTAALKEYVQIIIPRIKTDLASQATQITDKATQIKVQKLSEMLCTVENMKTIKESHILSLLRYFDLVRELKEMH